MNKIKLSKSLAPIVLPTYVDEDGNRYIKIRVASDDTEKATVAIYQRVDGIASVNDRETSGVLLSGTTLEVYDVNLINVQLNPGETTFFAENVKLEEG